MTKSFETVYVALYMPKNNVQAAIFEAKRSWKKAIAMAADLEYVDDIKDAAHYLDRVLSEEKILKQEVKI